MRSPDEAETEAKELFDRVQPLFDNHTSYAIMRVLAHLFAGWMINIDERHQEAMIMLFHKTAMAIYELELERETTH